MSALINDMIKKFDIQIAANEAEGIQLRAGREALVKVQGGAVSAIKRRGRQPKAAGSSNGIELAPHANSAAAKDATLATYTSS